MLPHFAHPFRISGRRAGTVEQGSSAEVAQCVFCILGSRPGSREDFPDLGIEDPAFGELDLDDIRSQVEDHEPRAELMADSELSALVQKVSLRVALR